jgi:hypothetical protein
MKEKGNIQKRNRKNTHETNIFRGVGVKITESDTRTESEENYKIGLGQRNNKGRKGKEENKKFLI